MSRVARRLSPDELLIRVRRASSIVTLLPGDLIFTGTPEGVGVSRDPARFLAPGDELVTTIEGVGEIRTTFVGTP